MPGLVRVAAWTASVIASVMVATACGDAKAAGGIPSYSPGPDVPGATFTFEAEDGAHPVDGRSGEWAAPDQELMVWEHENIVKVDAAGLSNSDFIRVELSAPGRVPLEEGGYPDARNQDKAPERPGMLVVSGGLGCGDEYGEFVVDRIERDRAGSLVALDAGFTQRCGGPDGPALHGRVHFRS